MNKFIEKIISDIKSKIISESYDTTFQLYSYDGVGVNELYFIDSFKNDSEKEKVSKKLRNIISIEKPEFVISVCIGLMSPMKLKKTRKDKREVLIICFENSDGLYHVENFYINRNRKKIQGLSPAWSYDHKVIVENNFSISGVLCSWYISLEEVYDYIREANQKVMNYKVH